MTTHAGRGSARTFIESVDQKQWAINDLKAGYVARASKPRTVGRSGRKFRKAPRRVSDSKDRPFAPATSEFWLRDRERDSVEVLDLPALSLSGLWTSLNVRIEWDLKNSPIAVESTGAKLDRIEIDGDTKPGSSVRQDAAAIRGGGYTITNFYIHDVPEGPHLKSNITMRVGIIDRLVTIGSNHVDALQIYGVTKNVRVEQFFIRGLNQNGTRTGVNAALQAGTELGAVSNVTFSRNYFDGGFVPINLGGGGTRDVAIRFENNLFGRTAGADVIKHHSSSQTFVNNVFADNGKAIPLD